MVRQWPLVGRSEELALIADAARASADRARGIVLSGAAGVGKTRLAHDALAVCGPPDARRRWIAGTASARSVPLGAFADIASDFGPDPLRRVREVIDGLIADGQDRPVVVGIDDAHLLDELSAFTVHQLVTRHQATVILTIRSGEFPPDAITAIWKDHHLERLELQPLSLKETTALIEHVLGGPVESLSARRLWQFTQGNVLYLRHLVESEVHTGRIARPSGVWLWDGSPSLSPTLAEFLEAAIGHAPASVRDVLDALAVSEPLDADILATLTGEDAVLEAEALGLVRVDSRVRPATVRLAHPLFGEVRRNGSLHLQRLRGRIVTELVRKPTTDPRDLVRRAALTIESDLKPDPELLLAAAVAALQLLDLRLAETLAERAVAAGGGLEAKIAHATALVQQERGSDAEPVLAELVDQTTGPLRAQLTIFRAATYAVVFGQTANAERIVNESLAADDDAAQTIRGMIDVARGHARTAVDRVNAVLESPPSDDITHLISIVVLLGGLGALGRIDEITAAADRGYRLAQQSPAVSHGQFQLAFLQANAYRLAGALTQSNATIERIRRETLDVPYEQSWHAFLAGMSAMSRGALSEGQRLLREALAYLGTGDMGRLMKALGGSWLATVTGMAGRAADARREFAATQWWNQDADACEWTPERSIAEAWVRAAEGAVSQAISIIRDAAARECELDRLAVELCLLQTATQFGDHTTAVRLAELADQVQGPRASAAAGHAAALAAGSGDGLVEASRQYEGFGDRLAAADAAAQAVVAYQDAGRRSAAMSASATAQRLATECQGAQTPALRAAATTPQVLTGRQLEIISLAAQGLSNKQIADRLTMSIRSVEGHLFRASQRVAANSREQLIALLQGS